MKKRLAQAASMAALLAMMATPAYAQGLGLGLEKNGLGNGRGLGASVSVMARADKDSDDDHDNGRGNDDREKKEKKEKKDKEEKRRFISSCLKSAQQAYDAALRAANKTRLDARSAARKAYNKAINDAWKLRVDARAAARVTFNASTKDEAARKALVEARVKANLDWQEDRKDAKKAFDAAMDAAQTAWKTAKAKADADFKAAKEKCNAGTPTPGTDTTAPAAATLSLSGATSSSILVSWNAPGDDGSTGTAASYDLRYSTSPIVTEADFTAATQVTGEPTPLVAGTAQSMTVSGLTASTTYHFAMKTKDEVPNVSALSNVPSLATLAIVADTTAPAAVANLSLSAPTASSMIVAWAAPGDDGSTGTAASYDLRYSTSPIVTEADFTAATQVTGEPTPTAAGTTQSMTVSGLTASTTYHFAIKASDEVPNVSALSNVPSLATLALADTTAPAAITLSLSGATSSSILVSWLAPGDDGSAGTAASYDLRYSTSPIVTEADFTAATQVTGEPTPLLSGMAQSMTVSGLTAATTYYFAAKSLDEVPNTSAMSNVPSLATL